jgi:flavin reductase (DIM6/NTAB) family NADH-FMN oxidoreductase RutF
MTTDTETLLIDEYREAMRRVASTVNIITICVDGQPMGITATAMSSLAMDPPSLLVCINQTASLHGSMTGVSHFGVNVLHRDQENLARLFADKSMRELRFSSGWHFDQAGPPRLPDAQASILCRRTGHHQFGTHSIFIGVVEDVVIRSDVQPLVYLNGNFGTVQS